MDSNIATEKGNLVTVNVGSHNTVILNKMFGPLDMHSLEITMDSKLGEWVIRRIRYNFDGTREIKEDVARISGCVGEEDEASPHEGC